MEAIFRGFFMPKKWTGWSIPAIGAIRKCPPTDGAMHNVATTYHHPAKDDKLAFERKALSFYETN